MHCARTTNCQRPSPHPGASASSRSAGSCQLQQVEKGPQLGSACQVCQNCTANTASDANDSRYCLVYFKCQTSMARAVASDSSKHNVPSHIKAPSSCERSGICAHKFRVCSRGSLEIQEKQRCPRCILIRVLRLLWISHSPFPSACSISVGPFDRATPLQRAWKSAKSGQQGKLIAAAFPAAVALTQAVAHAKAEHQSPLHWSSTDPTEACAVKQGFQTSRPAICQPGCPPAPVGHRRPARTAAAKIQSLRR